MLEVEIKNLKEEVANLSTLFAELITILRNDDITSAKRSTVAAALEPQAETVKPEQQVEVKAETPTIQRDDVQSLCTQLMRKDRGLKDAIKETIASFDGATNLVKVDEKHLADLHSKLSELL